MKLLLRKDIPHLGLCGDIVQVSSGYARNYLIPHHLALVPTKANLRIIDEDKRKAAEDRERRHAFLRSMAERLAGVEVTISAACNPEGHLYGSVGPREISRALMDEGHSVHPDQIKMSTNIKQVGAQEVDVSLADDIHTHVKVWVVAEKAAVDLDAAEDGERQAEDDQDNGAAADPRDDAIDAGAADD